MRRVYIVKTRIHYCNYYFYDLLCNDASTNHAPDRLFLGGDGAIVLPGTPLPFITRHGGEGI